MQHSESLQQMSFNTIPDCGLYYSNGRPSQARRCTRSDSNFVQPRRLVSARQSLKRYNPGLEPISDSNLVQPRGLANTKYLGQGVTLGWSLFHIKGDG